MVRREELCVSPSSQHPSLLSSQELCKKLHAKIESVDEERYDTEVKLQKTTKEVSFPWSHPSGKAAALPHASLHCLGPSHETHALLSLHPSHFIPLSWKT